jgi:phosphate transport system substrate-binding protein
MKTTAILISGLFFLAIFFAGCGRSSDKLPSETEKIKGSISISGAFALYPLTVMWADEFQKLYPEVRIDISAGGAGKGMADALSGMVDLGMFSRGITQEEKDKGCWWVAVAKDAVLPTVNQQNPWLQQLKTKGIGNETFRKIYLSERSWTWRDLMETREDHALNIYTRSDACGAAQMWAEYLGSDQESLMGIGVFGDPGMADAIKRDRFGIGFNNVIYVYDLQTRKCYAGMDVIPLDLNDNGSIDEDENFYETIDEVMEAIATGKYPSPPARDLYLVAHGRPENKVTQLFLEWILTKGQLMVHEAGYVQLPDEKIQSELKKLKE